MRWRWRKADVKKGASEVEAAFLAWAAEMAEAWGMSEEYGEPSQYSLWRCGETEAGVLWKVEDWTFGCVYILDTGSSAEVFVQKSKDGDELRAREDLAEEIDLDLLGEDTEKALLEHFDRKGKGGRKGGKGGYGKGYDVVKADDEKRYTLGVAYPADEVDAHGDFTTADELEKAAWDFMARVVSKAVGVGMDHREGTDGAATVVESYIYRGPEWASEDGTVIAKAGDWMVGAVWSDEGWDRIKRGEIVGWSIQGRAVIDDEAEPGA